MVRNSLALIPIEIENRVKEAMELVEVDWSKKDKSPLELSGGEKRRVAIAGVLAMKPSTLVMDEPMAGLDPLGKREILRLMKQMHGRGVTVVMVSHSRMGRYGGNGSEDRGHEQRYARKGGNAPGYFLPRGISRIDRP